MTDCRMPERWLSDRRLLRLSGDAFKLLGIAMMFSVANRTDGVIDDDDVALLPGVDGAYFAELESNDLVECTPTGWFLLDFASTQTSREELEKNEESRRLDRERKARERAEKAAAKLPDDGLSSAVSPGQSAGRPTGHPRQGRQGKARQGKSPSGKAGVSSLRCPGCSRPWSEAPTPVVNGHCSACASKRNETGA